MSGEGQGCRAGQGGFGMNLAPWSLCFVLAWVGSSPCVGVGPFTGPTVPQFYSLGGHTDLQGKS